jgi:pimeloyl-ACP methyl ester carboxylesterase
MPAEPDVPDSQFADICGPVHYVEWDGPADKTFVLVHGLGGSYLSWTLVGRQLSQHGRAIAVDLAGFGRTPRDGRSSKLTANRVLLTRFLQKVVRGPAILAGNSMGGAISVLQAVQEPATVEGLILTGSVFPWARGGMPSPLVVAGFGLYQIPGLGEWLTRQRFRQGSAERAVRLGFRMVAADPRSVSDELVRLHVRLLEEQGQDPDLGAALLEAARSLLSLGRHGELAKRLLQSVKCPVLVVHGEADRFVPVAFARAEIERQPTWAVRLLPRVGHAPMIEQPCQWIEAVEHWLGDATGSAAPPDSRCEPTPPQPRPRG